MYILNSDYAIFYFYKFVITTILAFTILFNFQVYIKSIKYINIY